MLERFGRSLTFQRRSGDSIDPETGTRSGGAVVDYEIWGAVLEYDRHLVDGSLIKTGDVRILVSASALPVVPEPSDTVVISEREHVVVSVKTISASGMDVAYELQVRVKK